MIDQFPFIEVIGLLLYVIFINGTAMFEAYAFHLKNINIPEPINPHVPLVTMRLVVILSIALMSYTNIYYILWNCLGMMLIYPAIHNKKLYQLRNKFYQDLYKTDHELYPNLENDTSDDGINKAILSFTKVQRISLAVLGTVVLIVLYIYTSQ